MANAVVSFGFYENTNTAMPMSCQNSAISSLGGNLRICAVSVISVIGNIISRIKLFLLVKLLGHFRLCTPY